MWKGKKDLLSMRDLSRMEIDDILGCASMLEPYSGKGNSLEMCKGEILINAFFEPSTRTRMSFETAMHTMGGHAQNFLQAGSSMEKGETIEDTVKTLENYSDILVIRHSEPRIVERLAGLVKIPVINGGDGTNEHPTQVLYDLYTIQKSIGKLDGLKIALIGDLFHNRPAHSFSLAMRNFDNRIVGVSPHGLEMQDEYKPDNYEDVPIEMKDLDDALWKMQPDVIYLTRPRKEYGADMAVCKYVVNKKTMSRLSQDCIVMHILPRAGELSPEVDGDARVVPFKQERYGLQVRMALLGLWLGHENEIRNLRK